MRIRPLTRIARLMPDRVAALTGSLERLRIWAVAMALMIGMPMVMLTCWVRVVMPVARPCCSLGRPEVAVTMKPTMAATWA